MVNTQALLVREISKGSKLKKLLGITSCASGHEQGKESIINKFPFLILCVHKQVFVSI